MQRMKKQPKEGSVILRLGVLALMVALLAGFFSQSVFARNSYVITDGENVTVHQSYSTDPDVVLDEVGIELSDEDTYTTSYNDGVSRIDIQRMQLITVNCRGEYRIVGTYGETVGELLERLGMTLGGKDTLSCRLTQETYDGLQVDITHTEIRYEQKDTVVPYEINCYEDPSMEPGTELVLVQGQDGLVRQKERVVYENGTEISREPMGTYTITEMTTELVIRGPRKVLREQPDEPEYVPEESKPLKSGSAVTKPAESKPVEYKPAEIKPTEPEPEETGPAETEPEETKPTETEPEETEPVETEPEETEASNKDDVGDNVITTAGGKTYTYTKKLDVTCTAYSCEGYTGITATGTIARVGAVAVDPRYIPLGTKMYIVSNDGKYIYGYCVAEDTGGSIKGNKIDLYFDTIDECWEFGVRSCTAYIIKD